MNPPSIVKSPNERPLPSKILHLCVLTLECKIMDVRLDRSIEITNQPVSILCYSFRSFIHFYLVYLLFEIVLEDLWHPFCNCITNMRDLRNFKLFHHSLLRSGIRNVHRTT